MDQPRLKQIRIEITDGGPSIPFDKQQKLFQPNHLIEIPGQEGWGVELALSKNLMKAMCVAIRFNSIPEQGFTFIAEFPKKDENAF